MFYFRILNRIWSNDDLTILYKSGHLMRIVNLQFVAVVFYLSVSKSVCHIYFVISSKLCQVKRNGWKDVKKIKKIIMNHGKNFRARAAKSKMR